MIKEETKQLVIELRKSGKTYNEIHDLTGVAKSSISDICRPVGLGGLLNVVVLTEELIKHAQELYNKIGNIKKVAKEVGVCSLRLSKILILNEPSNISRNEAVVNWRKRTKIKLIEYKGGKCECCGYSKCIEALEFHHLDPSKKDFQISGTSKSFEILKNEADKCILVCANCHREIHANLRKL